MFLAGDIGGTKVELALFDDKKEGLQEHLRQHFASHDYADFNAVVAEFIKQHPVEVQRACFGIAGPVRNGVCKTTNLPWIVDEKSLSQQLHACPVKLLNDLEANAYGIFELKSNDLLTLQEGDRDATGNWGLISPGTGLGEAGFYWDGTRHNPFACEGGHVDFAPANELECEFFLFLNKRYGHVSWERVVSGMGTVNIYQFLRQQSGNPEPAWLTEAFAKGDAARVITVSALEGKCEICQQALEMLVRFLAAQAGNLALTVMSSGGLFIGGGIAPKIIEKLKAPSFIKDFCNKGRLSPILEAMPLRVILNSNTALLGAAHYAARRMSPCGC